LATPSVWPKLHGWYQRNAARSFYTRPFTIDSETPIISFTFDDFPRSALVTGGAILEQFGIKGTYYASFGLMGKTAPTGPIFEAEDLHELLERGHELGCHTFDHCHSWNTDPHVFANSILQNKAALERLVPRAFFRTFSYPISPPRPHIKQVAAGHFVCARGGGQTFNVGITDLNYLRAYFLEKARDKRGAIEKVIEANRSSRGWLILATHDVCRTPTAFGCTPEAFEQVVRCAVGSHARILPVVEALESLVKTE
jgi:peptidoglycan/xylan/chitin deacetylase (PgdA/CDA1 family)